MTREKAEETAEILAAYADGKEIEYKIKGTNKWETGSIKNGGIFFDFYAIEYRIKKEPTYRPFKDKEECWTEMQKHQPFGWVIHKESKAYNNIVSLGDEEYFERLLTIMTFADGTPFGIIE